MDKRLILLMLLLMAGTAKASSLAYEGWIQNNRYFVFDDVSYRVLLASQGKTLLLNSDVSTTSIDLGDCEERGTTRFCFNSSVYSKEGDYKAYIYIYYKQPDVKISREVDDNILEVGQRAVFTSTISNAGDSEASSVYFKEDFPSNLVIKDVDGGTSFNKTVTWEGDIDAGESHTIEYTVESIGKVDEYMNAYVRYYDGTRYHDVYSDNIRMFSSSVLDITLTTDKDDYQVNEDITFTIEMENDADEAISVDLDVKIPDGIKIDERPDGLSYKNNVLSWEGDIAAGKTEDIELTLKGYTVGKWLIYANADYEYGSKDYTLNNVKAGFLTRNEGIEVTSSIDDNEQVYSNQLMRLYAKVKNLNSFSKIKYMEIQAITDIATVQKAYYSNLGVNETALVLNTEIMVPQVDKKKVYPVKFNITYTTDEGMYTKILEQKITVNPTQDLKLIPLISSNSIMENEEFTATVRLDNPGEDIDDIQVTVIPPKGMDLKGPSSGFFDVGSGTSSDVMKVRLTPPLVNDKKVMWLNFTASYVKNNKEYFLHESLGVTVSPNKPKLLVLRKTDTSSPVMGEIIQVTYTVKNNHDTAVRDIVIHPPLLQYFDMIGEDSYFVGDLDPGEQVIIDGESLRPKKSGGKSIKSALVTMTDNYQRRFNISSSDTAFSVEESTIKGPAVIISLIQMDDMLVINLSNIGSQSTTGNLSGYGQATVLYRRNFVIEENASSGKIPMKEFTYRYEGNTMRTVSNELDFEKEAVEVDTPVIEDVVIEEPVAEKKGFLRNLFDMIRGWFT